MNTQINDSISKQLEQRMINKFEDYKNEQLKIKEEMT